MRYRADVMAALLELGLRPRAGTPVARVREAVNDLYTWELRRMRRALLRGDLVKREYAGRVEGLRRTRYWVLSLPIEQWCAENGLTDRAGDPAEDI